MSLARTEFAALRQIGEAVRAVGRYAVDPAAALFDASCDGSTGAVRWLIKAHRPPHAVVRRGPASLHRRLTLKLPTLSLLRGRVDIPALILLACHRGALGVAKELVVGYKLAPHVILETRHAGHSAVYWASAGGHLGVVRWLAQWADPRRADIEGARRRYEDSAAAKLARATGRNYNWALLAEMGEATGHQNNCFVAAIEGSSVRIAYWLTRYFGLRADGYPRTADGTRHGRIAAVADRARRLRHRFVAALFGGADAPPCDRAITAARQVGALVWLCTHYDRAEEAAHHYSHPNNLSALISGGHRECLLWLLDLSRRHGLRPDRDPLLSVTINAGRLAILRSLVETRRIDLGDDPTIWDHISEAYGVGKPHLARYLQTRLADTDSPQARESLAQVRMSMTPRRARAFIIRQGFHPEDFQSSRGNDNDEKQWIFDIYCYIRDNKERPAARWLFRFMAGLPV